MSKIAIALINLITWGKGTGGNLEKNGKWRKLLRQEKRDNRSKTIRKDGKGKAQWPSERAVSDFMKGDQVFDIKIPRLAVTKHLNE